MRVRRERSKIDLQWRQIAKLWEPSQELSYLEGATHNVPHIPGDQICGACGAAKRWAPASSVKQQSGQMGSSAPILVPLAVARTELGEGKVLQYDRAPIVRLGQLEEE